MFDGPSGLLPYCRFAVREAAERFLVTGASAAGRAAAWSSVVPSPFRVWNIQ